MREITAEDITKGYDPSKKNSIREVVQNNDVLRYIAASDAAGRFIMTAKDFEKAALSGNKIQSQADLNLFIENASAEKKAAVGRELGIEDWNTLNIEGLNERTSAYRESGKAEAYKQKTAKIEKMKKLADSKPRSIPRAIALADGDAKHYADADSNIAIARTGDTFLVYDFNTGNVTRDMTRAEVNAELARYRQSKNATSEITNTPSETANATTENLSSEAKNEIKDEKISKTAFENEFSEEKSRPTVKDIKAANEAREQAKRLDATAKEKIKDYDGLSEANKSMIRKILREAEANGISEADALSYARVAARTGLDITFDKNACYNKKKGTYYAGFYDPESNRIVVNPETKKKHTVLLIHELSHAMRAYRTKGGEVKYFIDEDAKISATLYDEIEKQYADENGNIDEALILDEASSYYAEAIFGTQGAIDLLLGEKPTLKQKLLSFFKKSAAYYSTDEKLSKEARRHFRKFKAMFDAFTARNYGRNAEIGLAGDKKARRFSAENTPKITADMTDEQRYEALKKRRLTISAVADYDKLSSAKNKLNISDDNIKFSDYGDRKKLILKIANEFGAFKKYSNADVRIDFEFSRGNLKHSINTQGEKYNDLIKLLSCIDDVIENAIGIEVHNNINHKFDATLKNVYVLVGAFFDNDNIVPVKLEIKEFFDKDNTLYVAVALEKIKKDEVVTQGNTENGVTKQYARSSIISISDFFKKINPSDKSFLKYIPDGFLNEEQLRAKKQAIQEANDADYMSAVKRGDMVTAQRMVDEAAKEAGYTYKGMHGTSVDFNNFDYSYIGDDNKLGLGFYFTNNEKLQFKYDYEKNAYLRFDNPIFDNNPTIDDILRREEELRDAGVSQEETLNVIQNEFGYDGIVAEYNRKALVAFNPEQIKSADPVTYDDEGNVIPLSERFNPKKSDIRYSSETIENVGKSRFDEGEMVELPESASETLKDKLTERNIPYEVYGKSDSDSTAKIDKLKGVRFSMDIDAMTEEQYNSFGWVRANNVLTSDEYSNFTTEFAKAKTSAEYNNFVTPQNEYMIAVGKLYGEKEGVKNKIVFAKGDIEHPKITRIVKIAKQNETQLDEVRSHLYAIEKQGFRQETAGIFTSYSRFDFKTYEFRENHIQNDGYNNQLGTDRGAGGRTAQTASERKRSPLTPVVHTFKDIQGKTKRVVRINSQNYMIEGDHRSKYQPSIEAAIEAENKRVLEREKRQGRRYSMDEDTTAAVLPKRTAREAGRKLVSDGRYKQLIAGYLKGKSYSKKDAMSVINSLPLAFMIKGVSREKMAQAVWQVFNESVADKRMTEGQIKILARDLAEFFVSNLMIATIETPNAISAREAISNLKRGIASLEISASERLELQNSVKKADLQRILARWKFKMNNAQGNKNPISIASFIENLAKEVPEMGFSTESNPVQTLIVIDAIYQQSDNKKTKNIA